MRKKIFLTQLATATLTLLSQNSFAARFNFVGLPDPNPSASVTVLSDVDNITATITSNSPNPNGVGVSFNQGLGVVDINGLQNDINNGDILTITFDQAVNVNQIGMRLWGDAIGGDSANVTGFAPLLVGPGDAGSGAVDLFTLNVMNVTSIQVIGRGNVGSGVGGFFVGELDVTLATSTPAPPPVPAPAPAPAPATGAQAIPTVNIFLMSILVGLTGLINFFKRKK